METSRQFAVAQQLQLLRHTCIAAPTPLALMCCGCIVQLAIQ